MSIRSPDHVFDELLVMQYKAGDQKAMKLLIKRWNKKILVYAYRNIHNHEGAQDVAQEVWLAALKGMHQLNDHVKIGSWLLSIAHNKSMDWLRQNKINQENINVSTADLSSENHSRDEDLRVMRRAMQELSIDHRNILSLFYFCLLYTSPSPRDRTRSRMPSSA